MRHRNIYLQLQPSIELPDSARNVILSVNDTDPLDDTAHKVSQPSHLLVLRVFGGTVKPGVDNFVSVAGDRKCGNNTGTKILIYFHLQGIPKKWPYNIEQ